MTKSAKKIDLITLQSTGLHGLKCSGSGLKLSAHASGICWVILHPPPLSSLDLFFKNPRISLCNARSIVVGVWSGEGERGGGGTLSCPIPCLCYFSGLIFFSRKGGGGSYQHLYIVKNKTILKR